MALPLAALRSELESLRKKLGEPSGTFTVAVEPYPLPGEAIADFEARFAAYALKMLRPARLKLRIGTMTPENAAAVVQACSPATQEVAALLREEFAGAGPQDAARRVDTAPEPLDPLS